MKAPDPHRYGVPARLLHWLMALLLLLQIPAEIVMSYRGNVLNLWNAATDFLYSTHKSIGFALLILLLLRVVGRLTAGAPPPHSSLTMWQRQIAAANHVGLYMLLLVVPMLGWLGVSRFPVLQVFGLVSLPALAAPDHAASEAAFTLHRLSAFLLVALIALHFAASLYHHFIRRDDVLRRMLP